MEHVQGYNKKRMLKSNRRAGGGVPPPPQQQQVELSSPGGVPPPQQHQRFEVSRRGVGVPPPAAIDMNNFGPPPHLHLQPFILGACRRGYPPPQHATSALREGTPPATAPAGGVPRPARKWQLLLLLLLLLRGGEGVTPPRPWILCCCCGAGYTPPAIMCQLLREAVYAPSNNIPTAALV